MEQKVENFFRPMIKQMMSVAGVHCITEQSIPILIHRLDVLRPDLIESFTNECAIFCFRETLQEALTEMIGSYLTGDDGKPIHPAILTDKELSSRIFVKLGAKPYSKHNCGSIDAEIARMIKDKKVKGI